jgi:hypothetical protein
MPADHLTSADTESTEDLDPWNSDTSEWTPADMVAFGRWAESDFAGQLGYE